MTWNKRMAHQNVTQVKKILNQSKMNFQDQKFCCEDCILGKMHRLPFPRSDTKSVRTGELVHADLCGPMQENSLGGARYFLLLTDDYSHWRAVYFINQKSETTYYLEDFFKKMDKHLEKGIKYMRIDNGLEFANQEIDDRYGRIRNLTHRYGITHQKTVPYTPEQNGAIEHENRTIVKLSRTSLHPNRSRCGLKRSITSCIHSIEQEPVARKRYPLVNYGLKENQNLQISRFSEKSTSTFQRREDVNGTSKLKKVFL